MPILIAPQKVDLTIIKVLVDEKTKKHLESLGIAINEVVRVISATSSSVILLIKETRLALDKSVATKIFVKEVHNGKEIK